MNARILTLPTPVSLRVRCRSTQEQTRMMYLSGRRTWEQDLADAWRLHVSVCHRCGYRSGEHALWCEYAF